MIREFMALFDNILAIFKSVTGTYALYGLFFAAIIYIFVTSVKREKMLIALPCMAVLLLFFFPPVFKIFGVRFLGDQAYCRMLWCVPQVLLLAYAFSDICFKYSKKFAGQAAVAVICTVAVMMSGHMIYSHENFTSRDNATGFSDELVTLVNYIEPADKEGKKTWVTAEPEIVSQLRQISPDFYVTFDRLGKKASGADTEGYMAFTQEDANPEGVFAFAKTYHSYLILNKSHDDDFYESVGCEKITETENYVMYLLDGAKKLATKK